MERALSAQGPNLKEHRTGLRNVVPYQEREITPLHMEHSPLLNEFASFRFGTSVDGTLRYETVGDYLEGEWQTRLAGAVGQVVLRGRFAPSLSDAATAATIQPAVEQAIADGRI